MRKLLTIHGQHHPKADVEHLYVPRKRRKGPGADRSSLCSRNYKTGGRAGQQGGYTNTVCQKAPTQHQLSSVTGSVNNSSQNYIEEQDSIKEKKKDGKESGHMKQLPHNLGEKLLVMSSPING